MNVRHFQLVVADPAALDLLDILEWSKAEFGEAAAHRYEALIVQALVDIGTDPRRPGARERSELSPVALYTYHLAFSRERVTGAKVRSPRHLILYRLKPPVIEVARILHDSRDLRRHLPE